MEILQLKYFCDAAETQNFTKTAKNFLVPTSNISQTIKRLEKELGTPLFERRANKVRLNDAGLLFYKHTKAALELLKSGRNALSGGDNGTTIKISAQICRFVVMKAIEEFKTRHPEVNFIISHNTTDVFSDFDMIITDKTLDLPYSQVKIGEEKFLLAYHKKHFSLDSPVDFSVLQTLPFITTSNHSSIFEVTKAFCNQQGFSPKIALQSEDPFYVRQCVELGLGVSLVPELSWGGQFSENITLSNVGQVSRKIYIYKKNNIDSNLNNFLALLTEKFT